jgi:hypothetical protein
MFSQDLWRGPSITMNEVLAFEAGHAKLVLRGKDGEVFRRLVPAPGPDPTDYRSPIILMAVDSAAVIDVALPMAAVPHIALAASVVVVPQIAPVPHMALFA